MKNIFIVLAFILLIPNYVLAMSEIEIWQKGNIEQVQELINKKLTDKKYEGDLTPLHLASRNSADINIVKALLQSGAKIEQKDAQGYTALMHAAMYNKPEIVELLFQNGAKLDTKSNKGYNAFILAVSNTKYPEMIELFAKNKANVNQVAKFGCTPLMVCAMSNNTDILVELIKHGADVNALSDDKTTALMFAAMDNPDPSMINELLLSGADINAVNDLGMSALMLSAKNIADIGIALLELGANHLLLSKEKKTALDYARLANNMKLTSTLLAIKKD